MLQFNFRLTLNMDAGSIAAEAVWVHLEAVASGNITSESFNVKRQHSSNKEFDWRELHVELRSAHPHADASGALAWLLVWRARFSRKS
jgi:hypothetical protein